MDAQVAFAPDLLLGVLALFGEMSPFSSTLDVKGCFALAVFAFACVQTYKMCAYF